MDLTLERIFLPLRVNWKISRNSSNEKTNFIFTLRDRGIETRSEIAPNIRYGETHELIESQFNEFKRFIDGGTPYPQALDAKGWGHSLRFALESAWCAMQAREQGRSLADWLGATGSLRMPTSISIPIMSANEVETYLASLRRFRSFKVKVSQESAVEMLETVRKTAPNVPLRIDGNEAWDNLDDFLRFQDLLTGPIEFIEQPFPASRPDLYRALRDRTPYIVMADESIEDTDNLEELATMFGAVNIKLMKTGSLLKAKEFLIKARGLGLKTMVGCMIETTLGISYALHLAPWMDWADLDGFLLLKEDPFHLVKETEGNLELQKA